MKEGLSLEFITLVFQTWISEKNISHVGSALRKAQLEARLTVSAAFGLAQTMTHILSGLPTWQPAVGTTL